MQGVHTKSPVLAAMEVSMQPYVPKSGIDMVLTSLNFIAMSLRAIRRIVFEGYEHFIILKAPPSSVFDKVYIQWSRSLEGVSHISSFILV